MAQWPLMDIDEFWQVIEAARTSTAPTHKALADLLAARPAEEILAFQERFDVVHGAVDRWDLWAAAYLIGGGCSDDGFIDFRAGLITQGRAWYQRAALHPDDLADHPTVRLAGPDPGEELFYEEINYAAAAAFARHTGDRDAFYTELARRETAPSQEEPEHDMGEDFDFDDPARMRQRLPRLAALYLDDETHRTRRL